MKTNKKITFSPDNKEATEFLGKMDKIKAALIEKLEIKNAEFIERLNKKTTSSKTA